MQDEYFHSYQAYSAWEAEFCGVIVFNEIPMFMSNNSGNQSPPI